jgi:hypothetical protein
MSKEAGEMSKTADPYGYLARMIRLTRAAAYIDVSQSTFLRMVE